MSNSVKITGMIAGTILLIAILATFVFFQVNPIQGKTVTVQGNSELKVIPDKISVYFNVETKGETAKEAKDKNSLIVDDLITALIKQGFYREDIQTTGFNVYEDISYTTYGTKESHGYKAVHSIIVVLNTSQTEKVSDVVDAGIDANATLNYINFELSQEAENQYKTEALKLATKDAKSKAEAIAEGLGKQIGNLVSISDNSFNYRPWVYYDYSSAPGSLAEVKQAATNIQPSEQTVNAAVSVVYKII